MPDRKFDLGDYVEVKDRIRIFYELYGQGRLVTGDVTLTNEPDGTPRVMVQAFAYRTPDDPRPGVGYSWMTLPGSTTYTRGSELENTETSAWGRAIASLGILVDKSIASAQEIDNKRNDGSEPAETRTTHQDGLIGKAITQGTQDFELRQHPEKGFTLPFRIKEGRLNQIVLAQGELALQLADLRDQVIDQRVTVWGHYKDESFPDKKRPGEVITYKILVAERVKVADGRVLPVSPPPPMVGPDGTTTYDDAIPVAEGQEQLFSPEEEAAIEAALP